MIILFCRNVLLDGQYWNKVYFGEERHISIALGIFFLLIAFGLCSLNVLYRRQEIVLT